MLTKRTPWSVTGGECNRMKLIDHRKDPHNVSISIANPKAVSQRLIQLTLLFRLVMC